MKKIALGFLCLFLSLPVARANENINPYAGAVVGCAMGAVGLPATGIITSTYKRNGQTHDISRPVSAVIGCGLGAVIMKSSLESAGASEAISEDSLNEEVSEDAASDQP